MNQQITMLTTTNFVPGCPSTDLIETMMANFNKTFPAYPKQGYHHVIHYDMPKNPTPAHQEYLDKLNALNDKFPQSIEVIHGVHVGLKGGYIRMLDMVNTPYIVFMEHDWIFKPRCDIKLERVIDAMDKYPFVHYIRFNRRPNVEKGWDNKLFVERRIKEIPLLQTKVFSNNPHILRTAQMRNKLMPIILKAKGPLYWRPYENSMGSHAGAFGIEEPLVDAARNMIRQKGWDKMHAWWGTYIYGQYGAPPCVIHMDGKYSQPRVRPL